MWMRTPATEDELLGTGRGAAGLDTSEDLGKTIPARLQVLKAILAYVLDQAGARFGILCTDAEDRVERFERTTKVLPGGTNRGSRQGASRRRR